MGASHEYYAPNVYMVTWDGTLNSDDVIHSFQDIRHVLDNNKDEIHILFDLTRVKNIPFSAPTLALSAGFMKHRNLGKVMVVGMNMRAQILADIVVRVTGKDITFYDHHDAALRSISTFDTLLW
ncbi:MAG: hypothetical protein L0154_10000 [Chloroflexi bacterium]|nr:hypothetical protein [Chloroflexota bacterium]